MILAIKVVCPVIFLGIIYNNVAQNVVLILEPPNITTKSRDKGYVFVIGAVRTVHGKIVPHRVPIFHNSFSIVVEVRTVCNTSFEVTCWIDVHVDKLLLHRKRR